MSSLRLASAEQHVEIASKVLDPSLDRSWIVPRLGQDERSLVDRDEMVGDASTVEINRGPMNLLGGLELRGDLVAPTSEALSARLPQPRVRRCDLLSEVSEEAALLDSGLACQSYEQIQVTVKPRERILDLDKRGRLNSRLSRRPVMAQHLLPEVFLRSEVVEEASLGQVRAGADLVDSRSREALLQHQLLGGLEQLDLGRRIGLLGSRGAGHTYQLVRKFKSQVGLGQVGARRPSRSRRRRVSHASAFPRYAEQRGVPHRGSPGQRTRVYLGDALAARRFHPAIARDRNTRRASRLCDPFGGPQIQLR